MLGLTLLTMTIGLLLVLAADRPRWGVTPEARLGYHRGIIICALCLAIVSWLFLSGWLTEPLTDPASQF